MSTTCVRELLVEQMRIESEGVMSVVLRAPDESELPEWSAGAHIDVEVAPGTVRQYSLCGDPDDTRRWRIGVLRERESRGGSVRVHDHLRPGHTVRCSDPSNNFELEDGDRPLTFIAGGIGITPILAMARAAHRAGREFSLHYGGRSRAAMAFQSELHEFAGRVSVYSDDVDGPLDLDAICADVAGAGGQVYSCGPTGLLDALAERAAEWPPGTLRLERFVPKVHEAPVGGERSFTVRCAESGTTVQVPPNQTILESLEAAGIDVPFSCREGTCGTCETAILSGRADHRDSLLSSEEQEANETMLLCVSRASTDELELEI